MVEAGDRAMIALAMTQDRREMIMTFASDPLQPKMDTGLPVRGHGPLQVPLTHLG
jgi:hypothetical protein